MATPPLIRTIEVLLVEDNPGDVRLTCEALKDARVANKISVVVDGEEAIAYLRRQGKYEDAATPDLIFLDLNLPKMDGREVLADIKNDPVLRRIPVVVLTSSQSEEDVFRSYDLHANCFVTKPVSLDQFLKAVRDIEDFWFAVVKLPH